MNSNPFETPMVDVPGGEFVMGKTDKGKDNRRSKPAHQVTISDFQMAAYPVTFEQYDQFCSETGHIKINEKFRGAPNCPVVGVSWNDARFFCQWLKDKTNQPFRLPTEAEWEYAARGGQRTNGSNGSPYAGGGNINMVGWYLKNAKEKTRPVRKKMANELGLYDMCGNVWEWCHDWYAPYATAAQRDPLGPREGKTKVIRGGSCRDNLLRCRVYSRASQDANARSGVTGFRVACGR